MNPTDVCGYTHGKGWICQALKTGDIVSGGRMFLRDQELLFCYDVSARQSR